MRRSRFLIALFTLYFSFFSFSTYFLLPSPVRASPTSVRFLYDGDGVRVAKIEEGKTTLYIGETEKEIETGKITRYYSQGGKRIAVKDQSGVNYIAADHLGSTRSLTNSSGTKISEAKYYPYGQLRSQPAPLLSRQYTGQINDSSTQLLFYNARYYNPVTASFISSAIGNTANRYTYVGGNPLVSSDPTGRDEPDEPIDFVPPNLTPEVPLSSSEEINSTLKTDPVCIMEGCTMEGLQMQGMQGLIFTGLFVVVVIFVAANAPVFLLPAGLGIVADPAAIAAWNQMVSESNPGAYTLKLIKAGRVPVEIGKLINTGAAAEMRYWMPKAVFGPGQMHRGAVYHEVWAHFWQQFQGIAQGNKDVFSRMYADNPAYFEALAHENTYKFLITHGGTPEEIRGALYFWDKFYNSWAQSGSRIPTYNDYRGKLEVLGDILKNIFGK